MGKTRDIFKKKLGIPREHFMQRWAQKEQNCKEYRSLQEKWRYKKNTSCKDWHDKGQKSQRPNGSR